jgi:hypothetical protein
LETWNEELEGGGVMQHFSLSWTIGVGSDCQGGKQKKPSWLDIEAQLEQLRTHSGSVTLDIVDGAEIGPQSLQIQSDRGNYLLSIGEVDEEDYQVRSFTNKDAEPDRIEILGNSWDSKLVCSDFNIVRQAFKEFFDSGDVSHGLLK